MISREFSNDFATSLNERPGVVNIPGPIGHDARAAFLEFRSALLNGQAEVRDRGLGVRRLGVSRGPRRGSSHHGGQLRQDLLVGVALPRRPIDQ